MSLLLDNLEATKTPVHRYHIRFNTHHATSERPDLVWRVFEDGVEFLVKDISITSRLFGEKTIENGVAKWNVCTDGRMEIIDDVAHISEG